jgi:pimeloyl-ACP methyl ester carboxylesterase
MAKDPVALMQGLGFRQFKVASHDRGARVAHRLALEHPGRFEQLCTMDTIPALEHFDHADMGSPWATICEYVNADVSGGVVRCIPPVRYARMHWDGPPPPPPQYGLWFGPPMRRSQPFGRRGR